MPTNQRASALRAYLIKGTMLAYAMGPPVARRGGVLSMPVSPGIDKEIYLSALSDSAVR